VALQADGWCLTGGVNASGRRLRAPRAIRAAIGRAITVKLQIPILSSSSTRSTLRRVSSPTLASNTSANSGVPVSGDGSTRLSAGGSPFGHHVLGADDRRRRSRLAPGDRLILVDDWVETGSQFRCARQLVIDCGAELIGYSVLVDDLTDEDRTAPGRGQALVRSTELPASGT